MSKVYQSDELTDASLMRAAAAAVGFTLCAGLAKKHCSYLDEGDESLILIKKNGGHNVWNPLNDSGQALELAVLGNVRVNCPPPFGKWHYASTVDKNGDLQVFKAMGPDSLSAVRRSIVLAVAGSA